jgi:2',3'-cyclic-nucleotide 2'-phosphodiesterase/3'-nucleotidase
VKIRQRIGGLLLALLIGLAPWSAVALAVEQPAIVAIDILTTNDVHGALVESGRNPGMAKFGTFFHQQRDKNPHGTIFLSAGDMFQGSPDSNLLYGKTMVAVLNALQMDAITLGNHEFDWGLDKLAARVAESTFPYVSANVRDRDGKGRLDFVKPFVMIERLGVKIAVIGIVTPETAYTTGPKIVAPFEFRDPVTVVKEMLPIVRQQGAEVIVVLSHLASEQDESGLVTGDAAVLAGAVAGIDAVVSGHSHKIVAGKVNDVPVVQANFNARALGKISLVYSRRDRKVLVSSVKSMETPIKGVRPDAAVAAIIARSQAEIGPVKNVALGRTGNDLSHDRYELSVLGQWSSDALRQAAGVEIAFQNGGGLRTSILAGPITMGNLYEVMPFDNTLVTMDLTGEQVLQVLNQGINAKAGTVQFSGLDITIDSSLPYGSQLVEVRLSDGRLLDPAASYRIVTNDFMAAGGDEFVMFKQGRNSKDTFIPLRNALAEEVKKAGTINFKKDQRLKDRRGVQVKPAA